MTEYLFGRGIDLAIIQDCIADGTIFESAKYHNVVFIGKDASGTPKYAAYRGTMNSSLRGTHRAATSGIRFGFWQTNRLIPCIYLKPPLICCPTPPI